MKRVGFRKRDVLSALRRQEARISWLARRVKSDEELERSRASAKAWVDAHSRRAKIQRARRAARKGNRSHQEIREFVTWKGDLIVSNYEAFTAFDEYLVRQSFETYKDAAAWLAGKGPEEFALTALREEAR